MRTVLYDRHCRLNAKIVDFAGWEMPIRYKGVIHEHHTVRKKVGIFDVSHMGRILIEGPDAESFLDFLSTNEITGKKDFSATYTVWASADGGSVDDLIIYKKDNTHFFVVVNAGNREKDLQHLQKHASDFDVTITSLYEKEGILAIQGPKAKSLIGELFPDVQDLKPMRFAPILYNQQEIILSGTGYTGAGGCEIYAPNEVIVALWDQFLDIGQSYGVEPIGLGARDTLRLEMGFALYGHELSDAIAPNESVSAWTVKLGKPDFLGKEVIEKLDNPRAEYGVVLQDKGIAREGYPVYREGQQIGVVTSGTQSPTLNQAIAIVLVDQKLSQEDIVEIQIRKNLCRAKVVKLPFI